MEEAAQTSEADSCRLTTKHHLAKSSMAGPVFFIVDIKDAAIFKLEYQERHVAARAVSSTTSLSCDSILTFFRLFAQCG